MLPVYTPDYDVHWDDESMSAGRRVLCCVVNSMYIPDRPAGVVLCCEFDVHTRTAAPERQAFGLAFPD